METALITGSNGFIGSHLAEFLLEQGFHVRCMIRKTSDLKWLEKLDVERVYADLTDADALRKAVRNTGTIFHLGGKTKASSQEEFFSANVSGTRLLLEAAGEADGAFRRFLYLSSQAAGGPSCGLTPRREDETPAPVTWYGESKLAGEYEVIKFRERFPVTIIRAPSVYGPRDTDVFEVFKAVASHVKPALGWGMRCASFIYIRDLITGMHQAAVSENAAGETFYLVSDPVVSWKTLNSLIAEAMDTWAVTIHVPVWSFYMIAAIKMLESRITGKPSIINMQKMNEFKQCFWICDGSKAERLFNYCPAYPVKRGIPETLKWYQEQGWL
jgi:dihydroflavonol-4-reductase